MKEWKITKHCSFLFAWYDCWVGIFFDRGNKRLYFFPFPMFGFVFKFKDIKTPSFDGICEYCKAPAENVIGAKGRVLCLDCSEPTTPDGLIWVG